MTNSIISRENLLKVIQQPVADTHAHIKQPELSLSYLFSGLGIKKIAELAWGSYWDRFVKLGGWVPSYPKEGGYKGTWKLITSNKYGFAGDDELVAANIAIVTFMMARRGGANLPKNKNGKILPPNTKVQWDFTQWDGKFADKSAALENQFSFLEELGQLEVGCHIDVEDPEPFSFFNAMSDEEKKLYRSRIETGFLTNNAVLAYEEASKEEKQEFAFICDSELFGAVSEFFNHKGREVPENFYFTDFNMSVYGDHALSYKELYEYCRLLCFASMNQDEQYQISIIEEGDNKFFLNFDQGDQFYEISKFSQRENSLGEEIGVKIYDERGRFFNNTILIHPLHSYSEEAYHSNIEYIPSTGMFMNYLLLATNMMPVDGGVLKASYCARAMINAQAPFNATDEVGGSETGRRAVYEQFVSANLKGFFSLPFSPMYTPDGVLIEGLGTKKNTEEFSALIPQKESVENSTEKALLEKYDKIRIHKGNMRATSGHLFHFPLERVDEGTRYEFLEEYRKLFFSKKYSSLMEFINGEFNLQLKTEQQLKDFTSKLTLLRSTKAQKLTKRVALFLAVSSHTQEGQEEKLHEKGSEVPAGESVTYKVAQGNFLCAPGQGFDLSESPKPLFPKTTFTTDFARYSVSKESGEPQFSYFLRGANKKKVGERTIVYDYTNNPLNLSCPKTGKEDWAKVHGVKVSKGQIIAKAHYAVGDEKDEEGNKRKLVTGFSELKAHEDFILQEVEVKIKAKGKETNGGPLQLKLKGFRIETHGKLRNAIKMIPVKPNTGKEVIYNDLNENLKEGIELVVPQDADKSRDNVEQQMATVVHTMRKTDEGQQLLKDLNALCGHDSSDDLVFDARMAFFKVYDDIYSKFDEEYLRPLWVYERCHKGETYSVVADMYSVWSSHCKDMLQKGFEVDQIKHKLDLFWYELEGEEKLVIDEFAEGKFRKLNGATVNPRIFVNCLPEDVDENTNILVFYDDNEDEYGCNYAFWQRALAYIAEEGQEHVEMPAKQEISSITQVLSMSPVMDVTARVLATGVGAESGGLKPHPKIAEEIMGDALSKAQRWATLKALYDGTPIWDGEKVLPTIPFFIKSEDENGNQVEVVNPDIREIAIKQSPYICQLAAQNELTLNKLAHVFKHVVIDFTSSESSYFNMLMPVIRDQEKVAASTDSIGGHLIEVMKLALESRDIENAAQVCHAHLGRASSAFDSLLESEDARKIRGRMGVYAKHAANSATPLQKLWVPYSKEDRSYYEYLLHIFKSYGYSEKDIDGSHILLNRMPMPFPICLEVEVIYPGDPRYELFSSVVSPLINPLVAYIEGGDFDGDDRLAVPLFKSKAQLVTIKMIKLFLKWRTSLEYSNPAAADDYVGDHFGQKDSKSFKSLLTKKNLVSKDYLADLLAKSTDCQNKIGVFHSIALHNEIGSHIYQSVKGLLSEEQQNNLGRNVTSSIASLVLMEMYEKLLGGYDDKLYELLKLIEETWSKTALPLKRVTKANLPEEAENEEGSSDTVSVYQLTLMVKEAGLNPEEGEMIKDATIFGGSCTGAEESFSNGFCETVESDPTFETFLKVATTLLFQISKGQLNPFFKDLSKSGLDPQGCSPHLNLAIYYLSWNPELRAKFEEQCNALKLLRGYLEQVLISLVYTGKDTEYLTNVLCKELGFNTEVYHSGFGRNYKGPKVLYSLEEDYDYSETLEEREFPKVSEGEMSESVLKLVSNLADYLPKSRFGIKDGFKGFLYTDIASKLNKCSGDQLKAIYRFFFGYSFKDENGSVQVNPLYFLTGAAGTGKSFVTEIIFEILSKCTDAVPVKVGSTGVSTQNIGGEITFNSLFGQQTGNVLPDGEFDVSGERENSATLANKLTKKLGISSNEGRFITFIVDEVSMLSAHQLHVAIESARIAYNKNYQADNEYYNFAFLLVGDPLQLAPVSSDEDKAEGKVVTPCYDKAKFINFNKELSFSGVFKQYNTLFSGLSTVHRQGDDLDFAKALDAVAHGKNLPELFHACINRELKGMKAKVFMTNKECQRYNRQALYELAMSKGSQIKTLHHGKVRIGSNWWKVEYFDRAKKEATLVSDGKVMSGREAFEALNFLPKWVEPVMEVAVGMPFIFRQNDSRKRWVNGSIGYVHDVDVETNSLIINLNGDLVEVEPETCESKEYDKNNLPTKEYRGILGHSAFALTVQKTQGLTLDTNVEVNFNTNVIEGMNLSGLVYVALSRVTSIENLSIKVDDKSEKAAVNSLNNDLIVADSMAVKLRQKAKKELKDLDVKLVASKTKEFSITAVEDNHITLASKEQEVVFHKDSDTFDLITTEGTQSGLDFSALPEEVQSELTDLFNLNYEAKRVIKTIPQEEWATNEPSPYIEVLDDSIVIYDSEGNEYPIKVGTASQDKGEGGIDLGKHEVNFDKTYWVELADRVEQVQLNCGIEFGEYKFPSGKNLAIFDSFKSIKDFAELLNQYPDSIKEILGSDVLYWAYIDKEFEPVSDVITEAGGDKDDEICEEVDKLESLLDEEFCEEVDNLESLLDEKL